MERDNMDRYFEPPPHLVPLVEALPHLGGMSLAGFRGNLPDEMELHPVEEYRDAFSEGRAQEMLRRALAMQKVRDRMGRGRCIPIGVSRRGEVAKDERRTYVMVAYDYAAGVAVEITLDENGELHGIHDERYQPPPTEAEIARAIELARLDERAAGRVEGMLGAAIPFSGANNEFEGRRVLEVLFSCPGDRLPRHRAWVDLGTESVLHVAGRCGCPDRREKERS